MNFCKRIIPVFLLILAGIWFALAQGFGATNGADGWQFECPRTEIAPKWWQDDRVLYKGAPTLALAGDGKAYANGRWVRSVAVQGNVHYTFRTFVRMKNVEEPYRSVLARLIWKDEKGKAIGRAEYPATLPIRQEDEWHLIRQTYKSPKQAVRAVMELIYRWDADGQVHFGGTALEQTAAPAPRPVRLAAVHFRPRGTKSPQENLAQFAKYVQLAARRKADIVCLPEGITMVGTNLHYVQVSEPVPGPSTDFLATLARKYRMYIVAGIYEREGQAVYNTAVLLGRNGELVGKYRKVCLPREEIEAGLTPGDSFPVFDTDFARIGMMICWDNQFPEPARMLAMKGAEVIFMPIWGGNLTLAKARCIENQVYMVTSSYGMKTAVFGREGEIIAEADKKEPVVVVEVDLNKRKLWPWLGDFKNRIKREMPPQKALRWQ